MNAGAGSRRLSVETKVIIGFSLVALLVHLLTNQRYGYFRDELYFIACARHLDFGYVDLAPLSVLLLRIELMLFGTSLFALRLFPAIAGAFVVALTGVFARELGGRAWAVALGCVAALCALVYLSIGNFYSLNVYEPLLWTGSAYLLVRIINGGSPRLWLWFGVCVGIGLENKHSIAFFVAAKNAAFLDAKLGRRSFANTGASSLSSAVDLAGRTNCTPARAAEHHLANAAWLAHLGASAKHRAQSQECGA